jgi:DNA-binding transcriptional ArsR family regulator
MAGPVKSRTLRSTLATANNKRTRVARLSQSVPLFAALGDETRLRLVTRLGAEGPLSISRLTDGTDLTRQAVTKHLRVLARAGVARSIRRGREQLWRIEPTPLEQARRSLEHIARRWDEALLRMKKTVEEDEAG